MTASPAGPRRGALAVPRESRYSSADADGNARGQEALVEPLVPALGDLPDR